MIAFYSISLNFIRFSINFRLGLELVRVVKAKEIDRTGVGK